MAKEVMSLESRSDGQGGRKWRKEIGMRKTKQGGSNFTSTVVSHSGRAGGGGINAVEMVPEKMDSLPLIFFFFSDLLTGSALVFRVTFQLAKPPEVWIQAGRRLPGQWLLSYSVIRNMEINFSQSQL